jgi:hypothetical protein
MNIMSNPIPDGNPQAWPIDSSSAVNQARKDMESYIKRLMILRGLMGVRGKNYNKSADILLLAKGGKWKVYSILDLVKSQ